MGEVYNASILSNELSYFIAYHSWIHGVYC